MTIARFGLLALTGWAATAFAADAIKPQKAIVLFDGRNLSNFYTYLQTSKYQDPKQVFTIRDRMIRISGEEWGGLATRQEYRDYHLIVEWKWGTVTFEPRTNKARDSGILVHGVGEDGAAYKCWPESVECQVIEGGCGDFILVGGKNKPSLTVETRKGPDGQFYWQKGGTPVTRDSGRFNWFGRDIEWKDTLGFRGRNEVEKRAGQWNRSEVICDGDSITNLVNGVVVNVGTRCSHRQGKIVVQSEGAEVFVRRIELRPLKRAGKED